jgi:hypothetical protein
MELLSFVGSAGAYAFSLARGYWNRDRGPAASLWEVLLTPPVRVIDVLNPVVR